VAAAHGRLEAVRLLLEAGADPSLANGDGFTPLMGAVGSGSLEALRLLLARDAAVDAVRPATGWTAFHYACRNNQAEHAEALARAGCDVGLKDSQGRTGLELAEAESYTAVVERLRVVVAEQLRAAQGAFPTPEPEAAAVVGDGGAASQLLEAASKGDGAAVARLLAAGVDPNLSITGTTLLGKVVQATPLCQAAGHGRLEAARVLLEGGAGPDRASSDGTIPLMHAARNGQPEVLRLLLARGAAVEAKDPGTGGTAFHTACNHNQAECAEALARSGCDIGIKTKEGFTGQQLAEMQGSKEAARRLRALARQPFVGVLVQLVGLVGAAEHNGKRAMVWCRSISCSWLYLVFCILQDVIEESLVCVAVERHEVDLTARPAVLGAAPPAGETALHTGAAGAAGGGRRHGAAHGRAAGELCAGAPAGRHAVRPRGPGDSDGSHRYSPVLFTFHTLPVGSRASDPC
jgi:ankyrin repeat protein